MKFVGLIILCLLSRGAFPQSLQQKLSTALQRLQADEQCENALIGVHVVDGQTGEEVFNTNALVGLAPASCQKIITSVTAFEILGKNFRYSTGLSYQGSISNGILHGNLVLTGNGDPTLGSWRFAATREDLFVNDLVRAVKKQGIDKITGDIFSVNNHWETQAIPGGWTWEDIGNYYGAGASSLNWRENQYDLILSSGELIGSPVKVVSTMPLHLKNVNIINELTTGPGGSGDNTIIYLAPGSDKGYVRGTIPPNETAFSISGSLPDPAIQLVATLLPFFKDGTAGEAVNVAANDTMLAVPFYSRASPLLDGINYWFLKKSINLYGEAFLKTIALNQSGFASTDTGINIVKNFWFKRGIHLSAINIKDGSGLSPANRVTAKTLTTILQYAKTKSWFPAFYNALPEIHGINMKSGSINGVVSYAGYIRGKNNKEYTFSFIINNFSGAGQLMREKMWRILDIL